MIALDSSALIAYLQGDAGAVTDAVEIVLGERQACLPPVVLTEVLSDPKLPDEVAELLRALPLLLPTDGYWDRAGTLRRALLAHGRKARLADTLITQSCLDHNVSLVTADADFKVFAKRSGLQLLP
ncbi:MAG TPA: PIN domain-containing protein [Vicinamibacterales bacterium]|nr:PIN domain-containing protein [Vicinamibacterales bacterium]